MRQRGRKSSASLSVSRSTEGRRPPPPAYLDASATKLWKAIVTDSPSEWFTVAQEPLLAGFCSHASTAEFISKLIENERPADCLAIATSCAATLGCSECEPARRPRCRPSQPECGSRSNHRFNRGPQGARGAIIAPVRSCGIGSRPGKTNEGPSRVGWRGLLVRPAASCP